MKTIGLLGGMSWESSALYYCWINEGIREKLGGLHSAKMVLVSVDFAEVEALQRSGRWEEGGEVMAASALQVEQAGADFLLLCTNTMHKVAATIESAVKIPLLHIADATAEQIRRRGMQKVGLLGTRFTMEEEFYAGRLREKFGLEVLIPNLQERAVVHRVIYGELVQGVVREESRQEYLRIIEGLRRSGAEGVIEGCTEIVMLVRQEHTEVPLFDTTAIHAQAAVEWALR